MKKQNRAIRLFDSGLVMLQGGGMSRILMFTVGLLLIAGIMPALAFELPPSRHDLIAEAKRSVALAPNDPNMLGVLADQLMHVGTPDEAVKTIEKAMRLHPYYQANILRLSGMVYYSLGDTTRP